MKILNRWTGALILETTSADLSEADLSRADLRGADLSRANLSRANLYRADLSRADLSRADLRGADLSEASLHRADLSEANLSGADLSEANLYRADLSEADLSEANLYRADLSRADLSEADLRGANLSGADLYAVPNFHLKLLKILDSHKGFLEMSTWHTCETTHCRAGWAIHMAGPLGYYLEAQYGCAVAGALIIQASCPWLEKVPNFQTTNEEALEDIRRCAELEND